MTYFKGPRPRKAFVPDHADDNSGLRPSVARILSLVDLDDPSFPQVASVLNDMATAGIELDEATVEVAVKLAHASRTSGATSIGRRRQPDRPTDLGLPMWGEGSDRRSIVYYVRRGELIKIGTTKEPITRFRGLLPDEILAFEPGDRRIEAMRHRQFRDFRRGRSEYFEPKPILLRHTQRLRGLHGEPDPSWPTMENVGLRRPTLPKDLGHPDSAEVASAAAIGRELGIKPNAVRVWARRGLIKPVAGSRPNRPVYFVEHARRLAEASQAWTEDKARPPRAL